MGRRRSVKKKNRRRSQRRNVSDHRGGSNIAHAVEPQRERVSKPSFGSHWLKPIAISTIGGLAVAAATMFTPVFKSHLSVVNVPVIANYLGVVSSEDSVRHTVDVYFCVRNRGFMSGNVGRIAVNTVGLAETPNVVVQELDHAPISAFDERGILAKFLMLDRTTLPDQTRLRVDVYDQADRWIGDFALDAKRPVSATQSEWKASITFSGFATHACHRPD
jgi:hypothetical protein